MEPSPRTQLPSTGESTDYRPLLDYLTSRFADTVILTFGQIEDLIGRALPSPAYREAAWWLGPTLGSTASPQSSAWVQARRHATPNLLARTVMFDRA
jgi:hypothetical protein